MKNKKAQVFIVDDSEITSNAIAEELKKVSDCRIRKFTSAEDCLMNMEEKPDIIISDFYLDAEYANRMNGDRLLSKVKKMRPNVPVIMYSARNGVDVGFRLLKLGAEDFVYKGKNFIKMISRVTLRQINKVKNEYEEMVTKRTVLVVLAIFVAIMILLYKFFQDALPYFMLGMYIIGCAWLFSDNRIARRGAAL